MNSKIRGFAYWSNQKKISSKRLSPKNKKILSEKNTAIFYTNGAHDKKSKISAASVVLYQNSKILSES